MADVKLHAADAAELAEMLQFLTGWPTRDPGRLACMDHIHLNNRPAV